MSDKQGSEQLTGNRTGETDGTLGAFAQQPYLARRQNWVNQLERHALMQPGATALRFLGNTVTWADLRHRVAALAGALSRRGVNAGDRVMILMLNRTEFVESVLAANMIGAIAVPINFRLTPPEIAFLIEDCEARVMITESVLAPVAAGARNLTSVLNTVVVAGDAGAADDSPRRCARRGAAPCRRPSGPARCGGRPHRGRRRERLRANGRCRHRR